MRRPSTLVPIVLLQAMLCQSTARAQAVTPGVQPSPNPAGTAQSNVVLGRELINLTKQMESLLRLQQGAFYLRGRLADLRIDSQVNLDQIKSLLKSQLDALDAQKSELVAVREQLSKLTTEIDAAPDAATRAPAATEQTSQVTQAGQIAAELRQVKEMLQSLANTRESAPAAPTNETGSSGAGGSSAPDAPTTPSGSASRPASTTAPQPVAAPTATATPSPNPASPPTATPRVAPPPPATDSTPSPTANPAASTTATTAPDGAQTGSTSDATAAGSSPSAPSTLSLETRIFELQRRLVRVLDAVSEIQRSIEPQINLLDTERRLLSDTKWSLANLRSQLHINDSLLLSIRSGGADGAYDPNRPTYATAAFSAPQSNSPYMPNSYDYSQPGTRGSDVGPPPTSGYVPPPQSDNPRQAIRFALFQMSTQVDQAQRNLNSVSRLIDQANALAMECGTTAEKQQAAYVELEKDVQRQMTDCQSLYDELGRIKRKNEYDLQSSDANLNQFAINKQLVWAVYGMISTIVVLFILLRLYPGSLTNLIVGQRLLVEVLSMGFLLVTVIILGSGKLIQGEGLSGLLGTIAGYIFARKTAEIATHVPPSAHAAAYLTEEGRSAEAEAKKLRKELEAEKAKIPQGTQATSEQTAEWEKLEKRAAELEEKAKTFAAMAEKATNVRTPPPTEPPPAV